jgi:hypothetical protein
MPEIHIQFESIAALGGKARSDLLAEAADSLDSLMHAQGGETETGGSEAAKHLRAMMQDEARFAERPNVYEVTAEEVVKAAKQLVPIAAAKYEQNFRFYLMRFPFDLRPSGPWSFNELKVEVQFGSGPQEHRPKVHAIFPNSKMQEKLSATGTLQVSLEPTLEFQAKTGGLKLEAGQAAISGGASINTGIRGGASLGVGPVGVNWKKAIVKTSQTGLEWVWWEIGGAELNEGDDPQLMVILQVPRDSSSVTATGRLVTTRYYNLISRAFKNLTNLSRIYREFIEAGIPCDSGPTKWDLTEEMRRGN